MSGAVASSGWSFSAIGAQISNFFSPKVSSLIDIKITGGGATLADVTAHLQSMDLGWGYDALKLVLMARIAQSSYSTGWVDSKTSVNVIRPKLKHRCKEVLYSFAAMFCAAVLIETAGNLRNWDSSKLLESVATTAVLSTVDGAAAFRLTNDNVGKHGKLRRWTPTILATLWLAGRIGYQNPIFAKAMNSLVA